MLSSTSKRRTHLLRPTLLSPVAAAPPTVATPSPVSTASTVEPRSVARGRGLDLYRLALELVGSPAHHLRIVCEERRISSGKSGTVDSVSDFYL